MVNPSKEKMDIYTESCEKIVEKKGACWFIDCGDCPFHRDNNGYNKKCSSGLGAATEGIRWLKKDPLLLESAQKFLDEIIIFHNGKLVEAIDD